LLGCFVVYEDDGDKLVLLEQEFLSGRKTPPSYTASTLRITVLF
jgi:hypothetical protein